MNAAPIAAAWPELPPLDDWKESCDTLHLWTQIVGKIRLAQSPWTNHSWHVPLYVTARGLTTSPIPHGRRIFQIDFDLIDHSLQVLTSDGTTRAMALEPRSVADFHRELFSMLGALGLPVEIHGSPNEVADPIPFREDHVHASYNAEQVNRFWRALLQADRVLKSFRGCFQGKASPVHFFWGSFDLAATRFSGRGAPPHPGGVPSLPDWVAREAYSQEVSSAGFWPGTGFGEAAFYSYAYPEPPGFSESPVAPADARWDATLREFILPYRSVQQSADPDAALGAFLESTYRAAARCADWDAEKLERAPFPLAAAW